MASAHMLVLDRDREIHNTAIDELLALAGRCGVKHLPTGRICALPARHAGGCDFHPLPAVRDARRPAR